MLSSYSIRHRGEEVFSLAPAELWAELADAERFEGWWSWLRDLSLEPPELATGSVMTFTIVTPLPYRMRCRVELDEVVEKELIATTVSGDLRGWANLELRPRGLGSEIVLSWELEPTKRPMRVLVRVARPLIMATKDWAIDIALRAFRTNVEGA